MLTDKQIEDAKAKTKYSIPAHHEHNDCIRFAYEWLDAQRTIQGKTNCHFAIKQLVQHWAGCYVSTSDLEVAAEMHPQLRGKFPYFNLSSKLVFPSRERISMLSQAFTQEYNGFSIKDYSCHEPSLGLNYLNR